MYTLGAALGLILFVGLLKFRDSSKWRWLVVYALAAAAGLYTLYYFLFLIVTLNVLAYHARLQIETCQQTKSWQVGTTTAGRVTISQLAIRNSQSPGCSLNSQSSCSSRPGCQFFTARRPIHPFRPGVCRGKPGTDF